MELGWWLILLLYGCFRDFLSRNVVYLLINSIQTVNTCIFKKNTFAQTHLSVLRGRRLGRVGWGICMMRRERDGRMRFDALGLRGLVVDLLRC